MSFNPISSKKQFDILPRLLALFADVLEKEVHEKVLCCILEMLSLWSKNTTSSFEDSITNIFKRGLQLKSTTQAVKLAYYQWLISYLQNYSLSDTKIAIDLMPLFEKLLQSNIQITTITEMACITCICLKSNGTIGDPKLATFWNTTLDINKSLFFTERLNLLSTEALCNIIFIAERLLTEYNSEIKGDKNILIRTIVQGITSNSNKVCCYIKSLLPNIIYSTNGFTYIIAILQELEHVNSLNDNVEVENECFFSNIKDVILILCDFPKLDLEKSKILFLQLLVLCHHPAIEEHKTFWSHTIANKLKLDAKQLTTSKFKEIESLIIEKYKTNPTYKNIICTFTNLTPDLFLNCLINKIIKDLSDSDLLNVTEDEYCVFLTPDGELYDKSVVPNNDDIFSSSGLRKDKNIYNCKEQLEELQIRKEIEEKKRREGKLKAPILTAKQQEIIKNQTEKEIAIKARLQLLQCKLKKTIHMLEASLQGNAKEVLLYFPKILDPMLIAQKSPIAADILTDFYVRSHSICFQEDLSIGYQVAVNTVRLQLPHCDLKPDWLTEALEQAVENTLNLLYDYTVNNNNIFSCASYAYVFEFLKRSLTNTYISKKEDLVLSGIKVIGNHARQAKYKLYTQRIEMLKLLLKMMSCYRTSVQTEAIITLLEIAKSCAENNCVSEVDQNEINVLLCSLENNSETIRNVALQALKILCRSITLECQNDNLFGQNVTKRIWISKFDVSQINRDIANEIWCEINLVEPNFEDILYETTHPEQCIQQAAASSLLPLISNDKLLVKKTLKWVLTLYNDKLDLIPAKLDQFDRIVEPPVDEWRPRRGVAYVITKLAPFFQLEDVNHAIQFIVSTGLADREEIVHKEMLASALVIVDLHGKETVLTLLPVFEDFLDKAPKSESYDKIRQAVVILMGSLARHLEKTDKKIDPIVKRLLAALSTPSQQVQEAVSNCLPHLMPAVKEEAPAIIKRLLQLLIKSEKYGERRGAAYGLAGVVKGLGILSLKQFDIMAKLTTYIQDKKNYKSREGALFAFEILCTTLGRLFEPYIVHVLPHLLQCFGDSSQYVRQAADETAKMVMGKLSAHGVKLVLPSLLEALDGDSWRTKTASVELLGAMAYCAPKQLSSCLPSIVPKLIEVLGDSHTKVQESGADALKVIGSVIKNPEIQEIVPVLLKALEDPSKNTSFCLQSLLKTKFVHFIDAPSLALIMPVVQRAFIARSTETRKMAAQIIGNMYSLTDQKDLTPYLPNIIPGLKISLLDPVPEVRAISARALGAMVKGMGETSVEDLLPWLMQTLTSESSSVDRSGAAQGLSEVVGGLGVEQLHKLMPDIISRAERSDIAAHVKDGYIMMFIYMPGAFPEAFTPYIGQIINPILKALADENEFVRETALKAGQRIVNLYAETAVTLLLPELEKGLFDDNWRIRFSSVQLLGDLLYRISGVSGKMTTETASEDDNFGTEQSHAAIITFLGNERRNRVLSGLYMGRSDVSLMVRQAALHVWKVVVTNTPRTLREILPTLFSLLLGCLASTSYDKRQVAARTLGDLVRKLGERVLPEIIPILESGLNSEQPDQRQGVCIGLSEIMASTSKDMVLSYVNSLVPTVRKALSDPLPEVREAAAKTFESLHSNVGSKALDDILPSMLQSLSDPDPKVVENTLDGLRQIMSIKSKVVLPYLIPQLTATPVNTKALSILVSVAGEALTKYLPKILSAILLALTDSQGTLHEAQEIEYCQTVILSVTDDVGIRTIIDTLIYSTKNENAPTRRSAAFLLSSFCIHTKGDYLQYVPQLLRCFLGLMAEQDKDILLCSWEALTAIIKGLDSQQLIAHVIDVRQAVRFAASDCKDPLLPGFCLPKGISPLLPVFREAILNGLPEEKENAAEGLGEVIGLSSAQSLQPSVVHITGPLIRILGDRFNSGVKAAVLETLALLLQKVGVMLKQFLPQLQTTFLKALHDQNRLIRFKAGRALSELVVIHMRADSIFNEIHNNVKSIDDYAVRETMLHALRSVITQSGSKISEPLKKQICTTLLGLLGANEEVIRIASGGCLGALVKYLSKEQVDDVLCNNVLTDISDENPFKHGCSVVLYVSLKESTDMLLKPEYKENVFKTIVSYISSNKIVLASSGIRAATYLIEYWLINKETPVQQVVNSFIRAMNNNSNEIKQLVAKSSIHIAKTLAHHHISADFLKYIIPMLVNGTKEKNGYVKSNSEIALISILRLRENDSFYIKVGEILEPGAMESLNEVVTKVLRKSSIQPVEKEEEFDESLLFQ